MGTHFILILACFVLTRCGCGESLSEEHEEESTEETDDSTSDSGTTADDDTEDAGIELPGSCDDGIQNQDEEGIDCGGVCEDCIEIPVEPTETCEDGILNQDEVEIDCGGICDRCPEPDPCIVIDCDEDHICVDGSCECILEKDCLDVCGGTAVIDGCGICDGDGTTCLPEPTCHDNILNQDEEDIDCGGICSACPSCSDFTMNGDEAGIDCGGACEPCPETPPCETTLDCDGNTVCVENGCTVVPYTYLKHAEVGATLGLGRGIALSSDTLVLGAPTDSRCPEGYVPEGPYAYFGCTYAGSVAVFENGDSGWEQAAILKASNFDAYDFFGRQIAIDGDLIAVGAQSEAGCSTVINEGQAFNGCRNAGAVYLFRRDAFGSWNQEAYIKPNIAAQNTRFGQGLALSGNMLIVGAPGEDSCSNTIDAGMTNHACEGAGAVFVFERLEGSWVQTHYLKGSMTGVGDSFGAHLGYDDGLLAVGALNDDACARGIDPDLDNDCENTGAVYIFDYDGETWGETAILKAHNTGVRDQFGRRVSVSGQTVLATARYEDGCGVGVNPLDDNGCEDSGAAYVFHRDVNGWRQQAYLKPSVAASEQQFGWYSSLDHNRVVMTSFRETNCAEMIGAPREELDCGSTGAAFLYGRRNGTWRLDAYVKAPNADEGDTFGFTAALHDDRLLIGAAGEASCSTEVDAGEDDNGCPGNGAGYLYRLQEIY